MTRTTYATVFGGTGFLGRYVIDRLADSGVVVRVATRSAAGAYFLRTAGVVGQVVPVPCDIHNDADIATAVAGSDWVINLIGVLTEKGRSTFDTIHTDFPARLARIAAKNNVSRLVHVSALGADLTAPSHYARSKAAGENAILQSFPKATIMRPSIIFGPEDNFFNQFAQMASISPILPLIGGGKTVFQPVYVCDVADAITRVLHAQTDHNEGRIFELGGPQTYSFNEILEMILTYTGKKAMLLSVPFGLAKIKGAILQRLPGQLLTVDQVRSLTVDNVVSGHYEGFAELGITPKRVEDIVPSYLKRFVSGGRFSARKARAS